MLPDSYLTAMKYLQFLKPYESSLFYLVSKPDNNYILQGVRVPIILEVMSLRHPQLWNRVQYITLYDNEKKEANNISHFYLLFKAGLLFGMEFIRMSAL